MLKDKIRHLLNFLHLDLTQNLKYDRYTKKILKTVLHKNSNCIDIGCHKGEILDLILKHAPNGKHIAFEPIPHFYSRLKEKFGSNVNIYPYALSDKSGTTTFNYVKNAPAYSGLKQRKYNVEKADIEIINVTQKRLDDLIPNEVSIDLIKIDVEGGEFDVLKGAEQLLQLNKPTVIFECGKGATEYYGTDPVNLYSFITKTIGLRLFLLKSFIKNQEPLSMNDFVSHYELNDEYYFIASNLK